MEKLKNNALLITSLIALVAILLCFKQCSNNISLKSNVKQYNQAILALNDSMHKTVDKHGDTVYVQRTVQYDL